MCTHMSENPAIPALNFHNLHITATTRTRKRLFSSRRTHIPTVTMTLPDHHITFDAQDVHALATGPNIISAVAADPDGDYFLASPSAIDPSSPVGETLQNQQYDDGAHSLLLLHGKTLLSELSAAQQVDLFAWLNRLLGVKTELP